MKKLSLLLSIIAVILVMGSCKKDTTTTSSYPYAIRMTDAPGPYEAVFVDIVGVEIKEDDGSFVMMNTNTGIYNLLNLSNGIDTLLCSGTSQDANVKQIRLILGPNNSVMVDGVVYPLSTPSADQSGLKIQVNHTLQAGVLNTVLIDFDANKSIVKEGNGSYKLKPVIRSVETSMSGAIKGHIFPGGTAAFVTVTSVSADTYATNVNPDGYFMLKGLPAGSYSVTVTPEVPYNPVTINNVNVTIGFNTDMGTVVL